MKKFGGVVAGMFVLSLLLSIAFLLLVKAFPKCMIYTMIILIFLALAALIVFGIINQLWWMVIAFGITILGLGCVLFCYRSRIAAGIMLLKMAAQFISEKPSVYAAPLYPFIFGLMFFVWWIVCLISVSYSLYLKQQQTNEEGSTVSTSK